MNENIEMKDLNTLPNEYEMDEDDYNMLLNNSADENIDKSFINRLGGKKINEINADYIYYRKQLDEMETKFIEDRNKKVMNDVKEYEKSKHWGSNSSFFPEDQQQQYYSEKSDRESWEKLRSLRSARHVKYVLTEFLGLERQMCDLSFADYLLEKEVMRVDNIESDNGHIFTEAFLNNADGSSTVIDHFLDYRSKNRIREEIRSHYSEWRKKENKLLIKKYRFCNCSTDHSNYFFIYWFK